MMWAALHVCVGSSCGLAILCARLHVNVCKNFAYYVKPTMRGCSAAVQHNIAVICEHYGVAAACPGLKDATPSPNNGLESQIFQHSHGLTDVHCNIKTFGLTLQKYLS